MKYMFVIPSLNFGGAERVVSILSSELVKKGLESTVLIYFKTNNEYRVHENVKKVYLSDGYESDYDKMNYYKRLFGIRKIIKSEKPDYVIPFLPHVCIQTTFSLLFLKFKIIQTIRNNPIDSPKNKYQRKLRDFLINHSDKTIVQNETQKQYFDKKVHKKIYVLPNPVRDDLFDVEKNKTDEKNQFFSLIKTKTKAKENISIIII